MVGAGGGEGEGGNLGLENTGTVGSTLERVRTDLDKTWTKRPSLRTENSGSRV